MKKAQQEGLRHHKESQKKKEEEKNGECFEDLSRDGDMIINKQKEE